MVRNTKERKRFENADIFLRTGLKYAAFPNWLNSFNYLHARDKEKRKNRRYKP